MLPKILEESRVLASGYNPIPGLRAVAMSRGTCLQIPHLPHLGQVLYAFLAWGRQESSCEAFPVLSVETV